MNKLTDRLSDQPPQIIAGCQELAQAHHTAPEIAWGNVQMLASTVGCPVEDALRRDLSASETNSH